MTYDLMIRGGTVVDGTGTERRRADVGVRKGRIAAIGDLGKPDGAEVIDAGGLVVSPGFIDPHTHYDAQLFWDPTASPSPYHGVTTVFGGFCGFTLAPLDPAAADYLIPMLSRVEDIPLASLQAAVPCDWTSVRGFREHLEGRIAINAAFSVGHSALRRVAMGARAMGEKATPGDLALMQKLLRQSIAEGAMGFSSSRSTTHNDHNGQPVPSRHADFEEYVALAAVCREFEGSILEIIPGVVFDEEAAHLMASMSLAAARPLNWNIIVVRDLTDSAKAHLNRQLSMTDYARARGAEVIGLTLPNGAGVHYDLFRGTTFDVLPGWAPVFQLGIEERKRFLADPANRRALFDSAKAASEQIQALIDPDVMVVEKGATPATAGFEGKTLAEIGRLMGKAPIDALFDVALADGLKTLFTMVERGEDEATYAFRAKLWDDDRVLIGGSDAGAHVETIDTFAYFTCMLDKAVRTYGVISLEKAVQKMTQAPARLFGVRERGELREGWHADITIFDPASVARGPVHTRNDFPQGAARLYAEAEGVVHVIVNGTPVIRHGTYTGALSGTLFKPGCDTYTVGLPARSN